MLSVVSDAQQRETFSGAVLITERLSALVRDEQLIFNPNLESTGFKGSSDPHGRRVIDVCGTLHHEDLVIGLFEQKFALVRDPLSENKWKIKMMRLVLMLSKATPNRLPMNETRALQNDL